MNKIVGICLFKDEEIYAETVIHNIIDFCDKIIIIDNNSTDKTFDIVRKRFSSSPKVTMLKMEDHLASGRMTYSFFGSKTFLFAVDGDEIYDRDGLKAMRQRIKNGFFDKVWKISGTSFHVNDVSSTCVSGFSCPPNKHVTKLYNFNVINSWDQGERLHGVGLNPQPYYKESLIDVKFANERGLEESNQVDWRFSEFRCLHMCFVRRSQRDSEDSNFRCEAGFYRPAPIGHDFNYKAIKYGLGPTLKIKRSTLKPFHLP